MPLPAEGSDRLPDPPPGNDDSQQGTAASGRAPEVPPTGQPRPDPSGPIPGGAPKWAVPVRSQEDLDQRFGDATNRLIAAQPPVNYRRWLIWLAIAAAVTFAAAIAVCLAAGYNLEDLGHWLHRLTTP